MLYSSIVFQRRNVAPGGGLPLIKSNEEIGTIGRSRTKEQFETMQATVGRGKCPFCDLDSMREKSLKEGTYWLIKPNDFPYKHHRRHLIVVFKEHSKDNDVMAISPEAWAEMGEMIQWAVQEFEMRGGGIVLRFGSPEYNASTLRHLHVHIQEPDLTGPAKATFAKDAEKISRDAERIKSFSSS